MKTYDMPQRSPEWIQIRLGKLTASRFPKLFMGKTTAGYNDVINTATYERLTGEAPESFSNDWMERGTELESKAIQAYEFSTFEKVHSIGFVELDENIGCSPDGLIGKEGMIQIKCPKYNTLINYHLSGHVPKDYNIQMQGEMYITGRKWNIFYAWHPLLKPFIVKIERDDILINKIMIEIDLALKLINERIKKLR